MLVAGQSFKVYDEVDIPELHRKYQLGREYPKGYEIFVYNYTGKLFKIKEGLDKTNPANMSPSYLVVRTLDEQGNLVKDNILKDNSTDTDFISFGVQYIGVRKFIIIKSRFSFVIFNLSTNTLIIPKGSDEERPDVEIQDSQTFTLVSVQTFDDGQYIISSNGDFGIYCLNLLDLYKPVSVKGYYTSPPILSPYFFFLDHRKDNIYNGICVKNKIRHIENMQFLFKGLRFQQDEQGKIIKHEIDKQYLLLTQITKDNKKVPLMVDYKNGKLLDSQKDKELIDRLVKNREE